MLSNKILTKSEIYPKYNKDVEDTIKSLIKTNNTYHYYKDLQEKNIAKLRSEKYNYEILRFGGFITKLKDQWYQVHAILFTIPWLLMLLISTILIVTSAPSVVLNYSEGEALLGKYSSEEIQDFRQKIKEINVESDNNLLLNISNVNEYKEKKAKVIEIENHKDLHTILSYVINKDKLKLAFVFMFISIVSMIITYILFYTIMTSNRRKGFIKINNLENEKNKIEQELNLLKNYYLLLLANNKIIVNNNIKDILISLYDSKIDDLNFINKRTLEAVFCNHNSCFFSNDIDLNGKFKINGDEHFYPILENTNYIRKKNI